MSEDQIHYELSIIRTLINESNAELSQTIRVANYDTLVSVQARNNELKKDVKEQTDSIKDLFKWIFGILLMIILSFGSWLAVDHLALKSSHVNLEMDFGTVLMITSPDNEKFIGYDELMGKYFPAKRAQK